MAETERPPAPTRELGTATTVAGWWGVDEETTPELRWPRSVQVYDRMRNEDAQVTSVLRAVTLPVRRTGWRIQQGPAREEVARQVAEDLGLPFAGDAESPPPGRTRGRFSWSEHLQMALLCTAYGHMFFEQVYRIDENGRARLRKLAPRLPRTLTDIDVARDGGLESITQTTPVDTTRPEVTIPVTRLVAYVHDREGGNWRGRSLLRPAYKHWLLKDRLLRVQAQTVERNGMGIPTYEAAPGEKDLTEGLKLTQGLRAGNSSGAATPNGAKLRLAGVEGDLPDADKPIRYHDEQIARAVLAHFLNLGTQTGSWALGSSFLDFFTLSLQSLGELMRDTTQQHVVEDLVDVNWGIDEPAPVLEMDEIGSRHSATAEAIKLLLDSGALRPDRELEEYLRSMFGLPPKSTPPPPASVPGTEEDPA